MNYPSTREQADAVSDFKSSAALLREGSTVFASGMLIEFGLTPAQVLQHLANRGEAVPNANARTAAALSVYHFAAKRFPEFALYADYITESAMVLLADAAAPRSRRAGALALVTLGYIVNEAALLRSSFLCAKLSDDGFGRTGFFFARRFETPTSTRLSVFDVADILDVSIDWIRETLQKASKLKAPDALGYDEAKLRFPQHLALADITDQTERIELLDRKHLDVLMKEMGLLDDDERRKLIVSVFE
jgi:hypothetical protein